MDARASAEYGRIDHIGPSLTGGINGTLHHLLDLTWLLELGPVNLKPAGNVHIVNVRITEITGHIFPGVLVLTRQLGKQYYAPSLAVITVIVEHDHDDRNVIPGGRPQRLDLTEQHRTIAHHRNDLAVGLRHFDAQRCPYTPTQGISCGRSDDLLLAG